MKREVRLVYVHGFITSRGDNLDSAYVCYVFLTGRSGKTVKELSNPKYMNKHENEKNMSPLKMYPLTTR